MRQKLLFLIPLLLLILSATHLSLYKATVNYGPNGHFDALTPKSWTVKSLKLAPLGGYTDATFLVGNAGIAASKTPLSQNATFNGFPIGFYLKKHAASDPSFAGAASTVTAFSGINATIDGLIILVTLLVAVLANWQRRPRRKHSKAPSVIKPVST